MVLVCVECGCGSDELGEGGVADRCDDTALAEPREGRPSTTFYCPQCAVHDVGYQPRLGPPPRVRRGMEPTRSFGVTMVRPGVVPSFEVGAYEYFGRGLPLVGETILMRRTEGPRAGEVTQGYVTRVSACSDTPIAVTEVGPTAPDRPLG